MRGEPAVELIEHAAQLYELANQWWSLWQADARATPFQSPAWLLPWWRQFGEGSLLAVALFERERLCALVPAYIYTEAASGTRKVFLLGQGTTDYLDGLCLPGHEKHLLDAVRQVLSTRADAWDVLEWQQLRKGSPLLCLATPGPGEICPQLSLKDYTLPQKMARNLANYRNRARLAGELQVESAGPDAVLAAFAELVRLHQKDWAARGEAGVLLDERVLAMHREALPLLALRGLAWLGTVRLADEPIAAGYGLQARGRFFYYLSGFDPDRRELSPGTLLIAEALAHCRASGLEVFDFLRGRETYKYLWGAEDVCTWQVRLCSPGREEAAGAGHLRAACTHPNEGSRNQ